MLNGLVHELHLLAEPERFKPTDTLEVAGWFRTRLAVEDTPTWLAEVDGEPIGYLAASLIARKATPFSRARRFFELDHIAVHPDWRGRGIARSLFQHLLAAASTRQITDIEVSSWSFNSSAHAAFLRLGFQPKITRFFYRNTES